MKVNEIPATIRDSVRKGMVIPAMPLALDAERRFDPRYQTALTRYYIDAGVGGIAVGVHTTQFSIRAPGTDLFKPVLTHVSRVIDEYAAIRNHEIFKVAGICGRTDQAIEEASFAADAGYHAGLLSLTSLANQDHETMLDHCRRVSEAIPVFGFYLQPAVGGCKLPYCFWRRFAEIDNVVAIKIAPFNRYQTLDVVRGVCDSGREDAIPLYTGNDDNIVADLLTPYQVACKGGMKSVRIRGGLLGHWSVWTRTAVRLLERIHVLVSDNQDIPMDLLRLNSQITDCNAAFFDAANDFAGCIPGIHEVLRRQGLMRGTWCLDPDEKLSPGQGNEIDRVIDHYPHLNDHDFVADNLDRWLD